MADQSGSREGFPDVEAAHDARHRPSSETIWLDITDLYSYAYDGNTTVSGIQRVVANLINHADLSSRPIATVIPEFDRFRVLGPDMAEVKTLVGMLQEGGHTKVAVKEQVTKVADSRVLVQPMAGDIFAMAGAFWINPHFDMLVDLRSRGVRIALFVHDLIQINNPEYVHETANRVFRERLIDILGIVDIILTNSHFVADDVRRYLRDRLDVDLPVRAVPLPTELPALSQSPNALPSNLIEVARRDFVLCVGTIEIRKNHRYLVEIWERLYREFDGAVPDLVFVGKWGWKIESLKRDLENGSALGRWLHVFTELPDAGLDYLYEHCLFTAYVSFAEGFGLPVGESLAHGKPCVASNATSIPEVGGDFARYVDPRSLSDGYDTIAAILADRPALVRWTERIRQDFRPKTWEMFCREFYAAIDEAAEAKPEPLLNYRLPSGRMLFVGNDDVPRLDAGRVPMLTLRMARVSGWHPVENWGVWSAERRAVMRFETDVTAGTEVLAYLRLRGRPGQAVAIEIGGHPTEIGALAAHDGFVRATGLVGQGGILEIVFQSRGEMSVDEDGRPVFAGLSALAFCPTANRDACLTLLETLTLEVSRHAAPVVAAASTLIEAPATAPANGAALRRLLIGSLRARRRGVFVKQAAGILLSLGRRSARGRHYRAAERFYGWCLRLQPADARVWIQFGHVVKEQGDLDAAIDAYRLATTVDPASPDAFFHLGETLKAADHTAESRIALVRFKELKEKRV